MIPIFERFTERARQVVVLAQDEAKNLRHNYIGSEHLLLGLLREEEGLACRVLESLEVEIGEVRARVVGYVGKGDEIIAGQIPMTPRAKRILELALREALSLGHNYIGTEHILLGLVRENEGVAKRVLRDIGVDFETIRAEISRLLSGPGRRTASTSRTVDITEAVKAVLPYLWLSTEFPTEQTLALDPRSPAQQLRAEADRLEEKDGAIRRLRALIKGEGQ